MVAPYAIAVIGHGGAYAISADGKTRCSGMTDEEAYKCAPVVVDLTVVPVHVLATLSVSGPMVDPSVPFGMVRPLWGKDVPFDATPQEDRPADCAPLGNARGFDYVAVDVYVRLARAFGAKVYGAA